MNIKIIGVHVQQSGRDHLTKLTLLSPSTAERPTLEFRGTSGLAECLIFKADTGVSPKGVAIAGDAWYTAALLGSGLRPVTIEEHDEALEGRRGPDFPT